LLGVALAVVVVETAGAVTLELASYSGPADQEAAGVGMQTSRNDRDKGPDA
jgi:3-methyladenine DNA glycosylase Mpg